MATKKTVKATSKKTTTSAAPARQRRRPTATTNKDETVAASAVDSAQIASLAYRYFEESGRVHGHDVEHWLRAEKELRGASFH